MGTPRSSHDPSSFNELDFLVKYIPYRVFLIGLFAVAYFLVFDSKLDINGDNASYYVLGQSLAEGKGYVNAAFPEEPAERHFPIGYPLIIAGLHFIGMGSLVGIKVFNGILLLISGLLCFDLFRKFHPNENLAFVSAGALFLHPTLMRNATIVMSEIPFLFCVLASLWFLLRALNHPAAWKRWEFYVMLVLMGFAFYIKTLGIALMGAIGLYLILSKRWKETALAAAGFILALLPALLRSTGGSNYLGQLLAVDPYDPEAGSASLGDFVNRVGENAVSYLIGIVPQVTLPFTLKLQGSIALWDIIMAALILFLIYLGIRMLQAYRWLVVSFLLASLAVWLLWPPIWAGTRFAVHAAPVLVFLAAAGMLRISEKYGARISPKKPLGMYPVLLLVLFNIIPLNDQRLVAQDPYRPEWKNYFQLARWAKANTPEDAYICARKPVLFYLQSDRKCVPFRNTSNDSLLVQDLYDKGVDYVVMEFLGFGTTDKFLFPALTTYKECFPSVAVFQRPNTYLLEFKRELWTDPDYHLSLPQDSTVTGIQSEKSVH